nr:hypothetical protein [Amycolatopsis sp. WAC 01375]
MRASHPSFAFPFLEADRGDTAGREHSMELGEDVRMYLAREMQDARTRPDAVEHSGGERQGLEIALHRAEDRTPTPGVPEQLFAEVGRDDGRTSLDQVLGIAAGATAEVQYESTRQGLEEPIQLTVETGKFVKCVRGPDEGGGALVVGRAVT